MPRAATAPIFVPVVGRIAAGGPILAEQMIEDVFPLPKVLVGDGTLFLLKVVGDSMIDAAISDGDWVVVRQQQDAENGDIVAAMIDGEATVKTLQRARRPRVAAAVEPGLRSRSTATRRLCSAASRPSCANSEVALGTELRSRVDRLAEVGSLRDDLDRLDRLGIDRRLRRHDRGDRRRLGRARCRLLRSRVAGLVVLAHAFDLGLEDPQRTAQGARGIRQLLVAEQGDDDDRQNDPVPGSVPAHSVISSCLRPA